MGFTAYNSVDPYGGFCFKTGFYSRPFREFLCFVFQMQPQEERKNISENFHCCGIFFFFHFAIAASYFPPLQSSFEIHRLKGAGNIYFYLVLLFTAASL